MPARFDGKSPQQLASARVKYSEPWSVLKLDRCCCQYAGVDHKYDICAFGEWGVLPALCLLNQSLSATP